MTHFPLTTEAPSSVSYISTNWKHIIDRERRADSLPAHTSNERVSGIRTLWSCGPRRPPSPSAIWRPVFALCVYENPPPPPRLQRDFAKKLRNSPLALKAERSWPQQQSKDPERWKRVSKGYRAPSSKRFQYNLRARVCFSRQKRCLSLFFPPPRMLFRD